MARSFEDFPRAVRKKLLQEVADIGPLNDFDIGELARARDGTPARAIGGGGRRAVKADDDYTRFVRPEYELGCDVGERRSPRFLATPFRRHAGLSV